MKKKYLGINIDHVATLRQARLGIYPEPIQAALLAEEAGADSITLHLREDRRHIQERDVHLLAHILQTKMNLEMAATEKMLSIASRIKPADCCLVPENRKELTTEGGLNIISQINYLSNYCKRLQDANIRVSLFIDADRKQIDAAKECGAPVIEIHTGHYADASTILKKDSELNRIIDAVQYATSIGLQVNAGHGLNYHNIQAISSIPQIREINIGHSIVARALFTGWKNAIIEMKRLVNR